MRNGLPMWFIYAINRRHLMRETFSERGDDEVNIRESIEERTALSERFGIRVLFRGLNKDQYLEMVRLLAKQAGLDSAPEALDKMRCSGSRGARQPYTPQRPAVHQISQRTLRFRRQKNTKGPAGRIPGAFVELTNEI